MKNALAELPEKTWELIIDALTSCKAISYADKKVLYHVFLHTLSFPEFVRRCGDAAKCRQACILIAKHEEAICELGLAPEFNQTLFLLSGGNGENKADSKSSTSGPSEQLRSSSTTSQNTTKKKKNGAGKK